ncbi:MAG: hypothetical protein II295_02645 [Akkermansia sp.]|nr:hypothetical protein [Akkermansia sp.]
MKHLLPSLLCLLCLPACQSVRTVYDEYGNEVQERPSGERSLEDYMADTFDKDVTRKKNEEGVPESSSNKVSRYQKHLDEARKDTTTYQTGSYGTLKTLNDRDHRFAGSDKSFDRSKTYEGTFSSSAYSRDLRPAFMTETKGIYGTDSRSTAFTSDLRADGEGQAHGTYTTSSVYGTHPNAAISRDATSPYYESRRNKTPQPRIIDHSDYYKKSLFETRALLGRDKPQTEEEE